MNEPDDDQDLSEDCYQDYQDSMAEIHEELATFNEGWAASNEDGWFYSDED